MARPSGHETGPFQSRPAGSSALLSVVVVGIVLGILVLGSVFILRRINDDDGSAAVAIPSPAGTTELVAGVPTATAAPSPDATTPDTTPSPVPTVSPTEQISATATKTTPPTEVEPTAEDPIPTPPDEDPTATEVVESPPTATEETLPTATALPLEGAFGFLPRAQLPSGGVATTLELDYQLGMSLEILPTVGTVYRIEWPFYSFEDVAAARDRLALQADVIEEGVGVYRVESDRGTLFVSPTEIIFRAAGFSDGTELPDNATAIAIARDWVELSGFIPTPMDSGTIIGRDEEIQSVVVKFRPVAPQPNLAPNPSATVNVGPGGSVLEVRIAWPAALEDSDYGYSDALDVWREVQNGEGFLEADISGVFATGFLTGTATISDYSTAYTLAGNPSGEQFLVPVIRFDGTARIDQTGDEIPIFVSIPVVYFEEGTAG